MKKIFLIFTCDANHYRDSKSVLATATSKYKAILLINEHTKLSAEGIIDSDDLFNLQNLEQTQNRSENYIIEEWEINSLPL